MERKELRKIAEETVIKRQKVTPKPGECSVECDEGQFTYDKEGHPEKFKLQVAVRKVLTDITVRLDANTGKLLSWIIPDRYNGATETLISEEEALQLAREIVEIPEEAELEEIVQEQQPDSHITNLFWRHVINGVEVDGDSIALQINSKTRQVISSTRIWHSIKDYTCLLSRDDAEKIARDKAPEHAETKPVEIEATEQRYIPIIDESGTEKIVRFVKVWRVNIIEELGRFPRVTLLNIDCLNGQVVSVEHSK